MLCKKNPCHLKKTHPMEADFWNSDFGRFYPLLGPTNLSNRFEIGETVIVWWTDVW